MGSEVSRYTDELGGCEPSDDGGLVSYFDYQKLKAEVEDLKSQLAEAKREVDRARLDQEDVERDLDILVNIVPQEYLDEAREWKAQQQEDGV